MIREVHLGGTYDESASGVTEAGLQLKEASADGGQSSLTVAFFGVGGDKIARPRGPLSVYDLGWEFRGVLAQSRGIHSIVQQADVVHIHGIWGPHCRIGARIARALGKPYTISIHGMLTSWALSRAAMKKAIYYSMIEKKNLMKASCLRVLTEAEAQDCRRLGLPNPIAIIPNAISEPPPGYLSAPGVVQELKKPVNFVALYLGRLHPGKNVELLCEAWARSDVRTKGGHLVIAGPDAGAERRIREIIKYWSAEDTVKLTGKVSGLTKWRILSEANIFVQPSASEGLSMAILEAMKLGVPVLATKGALIPGFDEMPFGLAVDASVVSISEALDRFGNMDVDARRELGARGRLLCNEKYSWSIVYGAFSDLSKWLVGQSAQPPFVETVEITG